MGNFTIIAAIGKNNELGKDNKLIFCDKRDMKFFRDVTLDNNVIMGKNTFYSIGRVLPRRNNYILSHDVNLIIPGAYVFNSVINAKEYFDSVKNRENFIIGGAKIYEQFLPYTDKIYLTEIDCEKDADTFFPCFDKKDFNSSIIDEYDNDGINVKHVLYRRRK